MDSRFFSHKGTVGLLTSRRPVKPKCFPPVVSCAKHFPTQRLKIREPSWEGSIFVPRQGTIFYLYINIYICIECPYRNVFTNTYMLDCIWIDPMAYIIYIHMYIYIIIDIDQILCAQYYAHTACICILIQGPTVPTRHLTFSSESLQIHAGSKCRSLLWEGTWKDTLNVVVLHILHH